MVRYLFYGVCVLIGWGVFSVVNATIDRDPPIEYTFGRALSETVEQGGKIDVQISVDRKRICRSEVSRSVTDRNGISYRVSEYAFASITRPGKETYDRSITVPDDVTPGRSFYQMKILFYCNWFHNLGYPIQVLSPPIYFTVVPKTN